MLILVDRGQSGFLPKEDNAEKQKRRCTDKERDSFSYASRSTDMPIYQMTATKWKTLGGSGLPFYETAEARTHVCTYT